MVTKTKQFNPTLSIDYLTGLQEWSRKQPKAIEVKSTSTGVQSTEQISEKVMKVVLEN